MIFSCVLYAHCMCVPSQELTSKTLLNKSNLVRLGVGKDGLYKLDSKTAKVSTAKYILLDIVDTVFVSPGCAWCQHT